MRIDQIVKTNGCVLCGKPSHGKAYCDNCFFAKKREEAKERELININLEKNEEVLNDLMIGYVNKQKIRRA